MAERLTSVLRALAGFGLRALYPWLLLWLWWRRSRFVARQAALRRRYEVGANTPIRSFEACLSLIEAARARAGGKALAVATSGSTREPKRLVYTAARLRSSKLLFVDVFTRLMCASGVTRMSIFVLAPTGSDASLTSALVSESALPSRVACAQAPYRVASHASCVEAAGRFGETAVRALLLAASNPGFIYATNPSTLAVFIDRLADQHAQVRALAKAVCSGALPSLAPVMKRVSTKGATERLGGLASGEGAVSLASDLVPGLQAYACWDGGYVHAYLERVQRALPPERYRFLPMYSMSTETVETVGIALGPADFAYLPLADGVLYEFLPDGAADEPSALLEPRQLVPGKQYTLVVSDAYGLSRYQTEDVFRCERMVGELPDLRFVSRRGLTWSFTGEKLTAQHLLSAYALAARQLPGLSGNLSTFPSAGVGDAPPGYTVVVVRSGATVACLPEQVAGAVDEALRQINSEYDAKRASGRLAPMRGECVDVEAFVARVAGAAAVATWQSQFKFLPLYPRLWT